VRTCCGVPPSKQSVSGTFGAKPFVRPAGRFPRKTSGHVLRGSPGSCLFSPLFPVILGRFVLKVLPIRPTESFYLRSFSVRVACRGPPSDFRRMAGLCGLFGGEHEFSPLEFPAPRGQAGGGSAFMTSVRGSCPFAERETALRRRSAGILPRVRLPHCDSGLLPMFLVFLVPRGGSAPRSYSWDPRRTLGKIIGHPSR